MFHPSHWAGCEIRFQSYPRPSLSPGWSPWLYFFTQAYTPWGLALFPRCLPPGPARGCLKHSRSAPTPLKGFEPIQGLCREGTKMGGWGVGRARTLQGSQWEEGSTCLLYPRIFPSPSTLYWDTWGSPPLFLLVFSTTRRECYLEGDQEICLK